ncbi:MAG: glycosyltransferase family 2 protein [bacterium]
MKEINNRNDINKNNENDNEMDKKNHKEINKRNDIEMSMRNIKRRSLTEGDLRPNIQSSNELVSIITPLYNSEKYIAETIESVLAQTYQSWEMIVVDDCSSDCGPQIVEEYAEKDKRIRLIRLEKNSGAAVARNRAIEEAEGRYLAFLDSDDLWKIDKLEKQLEFMTENNYAFTYTDYQQISEEGKPLDKVIKSPSKLGYKKALYTNYVGCLTAIYDTEELGKVYMPLIRKRQDYAYWLKILKSVDYGYSLKENLAYYRIRSNSVSSNKINLLKYQWKMYREIEGLSVFRTSYYILYTVCLKVFGIK